MLRSKPAGKMMWLDKVKSATMFFKIFKVSIFLNLTILFFIAEDFPLQRIVSACSWIRRNIDDDIDMTLQQYREGQKKKKEKKK